MWLYGLIAVLLTVAIAVQVVYLRTYAAQVTTATKVVSGINIGLLGALLVGVAWIAYSQAVR